MLKYGLFFLFVVGIMACQGESPAQPTDQEPTPPEPRTKVEITTDYGTMLIELFNETPKHRDNFIKLAKEGFYDSLMFHRVQRNFMIQGGDPDSKAADLPPEAMLGQGGPGYTIPAEIDPQFIHQMGALSAYHEGKGKNPDLASNGSQFIIVHGQPLKNYQFEQIERERGFTYTKAQKKAYIEYGGVPKLDRVHTVFGQVIDGLDVVHKIATAKTLRMQDPILPDRPVNDIRMTVKVIEPDSTVQ